MFRERIELVDEIQIWRKKCGLCTQKKDEVGVRIRALFQLSPLALHIGIHTLSGPCTIEIVRELLPCLSSGK